jgi:hypothetical protein
VGANFRLGLKKFSRLSHTKAYGKARLTSRATGPYVWVGQGFGGFLDLCEKVFFLMIENYVFVPTKSLTPISLHPQLATSSADVIRTQSQPPGRPFRIHPAPILRRRRTAASQPQPPRLPVAPLPSRRLTFLPPPPRMSP